MFAVFRKLWIVLSKFKTHSPEDSDQPEYFDPYGEKMERGVFMRKFLQV